MSGDLSHVPGASDRSGRRRLTPVVLCVDVEPDPRMVDRANPLPWDGFERSVELLRGLRGRLSEATGRPALFTWFLRLDPQIAETWGTPAWVAERYGDLLRELSDTGDELGLHTHLWRWDSQASQWFIDFQDPDWAKHCVTMGLDAFKSAFARRCTAHRAGDRFLSGEMLVTLEGAGVKVDLTVEPGLPPLQGLEGETVRGWSPEYRGVPPTPYRSNPHSFPAPDADEAADPLLIPLLSAPRLRPPFRRLPLYLWEPSRRFGQRLALEVFRKRPPVTAFALRTDTATYPELWKKVDENLKLLTKRRQTAFLTASEAAGSVIATG